MSKWTGDCNNDGIIDCDDFAAIHKMGPVGCKNQAVLRSLLSAYWQKYSTCSSGGGGGGSGGGGGFTGSDDNPSIDPRKFMTIPVVTIIIIVIIINAIDFFCSLPC